MISVHKPFRSLLATVLVAVLITAGCSSSETDTEVFPPPTPVSTVPADDGDNQQSVEPAESPTSKMPDDETTPPDSIDMDKDYQGEDVPSFLDGIQPATNEEIENFLDERGLAGDPEILITSGHPLHTEMLTITDGLATCVYYAWTDAMRPNEDSSGSNTDCILKWEEQSSEPLRIIGSLDARWSMCGEGTDQQMHRQWESRMIAFFNSIQAVAVAHLAKESPPSDSPSLYDLELEAADLAACGLVFSSETLTTPNIGITKLGAASVFASMGVVARALGFLLYECDNHDSAACGLLSVIASGDLFELSEEIA